MRGQLKEASCATSRAYGMFRKEGDPDLEVAGSGVEETEEEVEEVQMSQAITIMKPILRFLQLLCENHNRHLQVQQCQTQLLASQNQYISVGRLNTCLKCMLYCCVTIHSFCIA